MVFSLRSHQLNYSQSDVRGWPSGSLVTEGFRVIVLRAPELNFSSVTGIASVVGCVTASGLCSVESECWPLTPRYVGELISDSEADVREEDSYLFDLDNKVTLRMDAKGLHTWPGLSWGTDAHVPIQCPPLFSAASSVLQAQTVSSVGTPEPGGLSACTVHLVSEHRVAGTSPGLSSPLEPIVCTATARLGSVCVQRLSEARASLAWGSGAARLTRVVCVPCPRVSS